MGQIAPPATQMAGPLPSFGPNQTAHPDSRKQHEDQVVADEKLLAAILAAEGQGHRRMTHGKYTCLKPQSPAGMFIRSRVAGSPKRV